MVNGGSHDQAIRNLNLVDRAGRLWVGTANGLAAIENPAARIAVRRYSAATGLASDDILSRFSVETPGSARMRPKRTRILQRPADRSTYKTGFGLGGGNSRATQTS